MEAHKEIARLDPSGRVAAPSASGAAGASHAVVGPRQKPHWGFIGWGIACVLLASVNPIFFLLGAALVAWGALKGKPD